MDYRNLINTSMDNLKEIYGGFEPIMGGFLDFNSQKFAESLTENKEEINEEIDFGENLLDENKITGGNSDDELDFGGNLLEEKNDISGDELDFGDLLLDN